MKLSTGKKLLSLGVVLLVIDQIIKVLVKTNMTLGQHISVFGDWFQLLFVENEGMAFGWSFGNGIGKFCLSFFRICLGAALIWWIGKMSRTNDKAVSEGQNKPYPAGFLVGLTLITAGALGNIVDCFFYGLIFSESTFGALAEFGGNYAPFMFGKVVDMFYFPIINTTWPAWLPVIGGTPFTFFDPVFNFADSCVTVGAFYLILFQWKFISTFDDKSKKKEKSDK